MKTLLLTALIAIPSPYQNTIHALQTFQSNLLYDSHTFADYDKKELIILYKGNPGTICTRLPSLAYDTFIDIIVYNKNLSIRIRC